MIEQEAILKAQSIVADAKIELDHVHTKTIELIQAVPKNIVLSIKHWHRLR